MEVQKDLIFMSPQTILARRVWSQSLMTVISSIKYSWYIRNTIDWGMPILMTVSEIESSANLIPTIVPRSISNNPCALLWAVYSVYTLIDQMSGLGISMILRYGCTTYHLCLHTVVSWLLVHQCVILCLSTISQNAQILRWYWTGKRHFDLRIQSLDRSGNRSVNIPVVLYGYDACFT